MLSLVTIAVQRHSLLTMPLEQMTHLCGQVIAADQEKLSPLHRLGRLTEFARELAQVHPAPPEHGMRHPLIWHVPP
eukprot:761228-Prymnesium_polylepis.1